MTLRGSWYTPPVISIQIVFLMLSLANHTHKLGKQTCQTNHYPMSNGLKSAPKAPHVTLNKSVLQNDYFLYLCDLQKMKGERK